MRIIIGDECASDWSIEKSMDGKDFFAYENLGIDPEWTAHRKERVLTDDFAYEVLAAVSEIPEGKVATYGQIARLIGKPKNSRLVGRIMHHASFYGEYPCHRVVNHAGRLVPGWREQAELLHDEGVELKDENHVALKKYQWEA